MVGLVRWDRLERGGLGRKNQELSVLDMFTLKREKVSKYKCQVSSGYSLLE